MECDDNILHAAYLKHAYTHAQAHSKCSVQCSSLLLGSHSGIVLIATNLSESISSIQNLFFQGCKKGLSFYGMDVYCPMIPNIYDSIGLFESGVRSITFHKEYTEIINPEWKSSKSIDFLIKNGVILQGYTGKVTKKNLKVQMGLAEFSP